MRTFRMSSLVGIVPKATNSSTRKGWARASSAKADPEGM